MKKLLVILSISIYCSCAKNHMSKNVTLVDSTLFRISKIVSINDCYIIYAIRNDTTFKIVSKKQTIENCNNVRKNYNYELRVQSILKNREIGGVKILPQNSMLVNCFAFDAKTNICIEPQKGIYDLYHAENLKGLCLVQ